MASGFIASWRPRVSRAWWSTHRASKSIARSGEPRLTASTRWRCSTCSLANHGQTLNFRKDLRSQIDAMRQWDGSRLPAGLLSRLLRYAGEYAFFSDRITELEAERRRILREERDPALDKVLQLYCLKAVGMESAWMCGTEFFGWRDFQNGKQVGSMADLTPTPFGSGSRARAGNRQRWEPLDPWRSDRAGLGLAAVPAAERTVEVVRAPIQIGDQATPQDRDRGVGAQALDRVVAVSRDGCCSRGRAAEDGSSTSLGVGAKQGKERRQSDIGAAGSRSRQVSQ